MRIGLRARSQGRGWSAAGRDGVEDELSGDGWSAMFTAEPVNGVATR
ncbi:MAG: hypothetical protein M0P21_10580 [Methanoculleus sp.]|nr:hypothetical protein [Methanoculleus sp.]